MTEEVAFGRRSPPVRDAKGHAFSAYRPESARGGVRSLRKAGLLARSPYSDPLPRMKNVPVGMVGIAELTVAGPRRSLTGLPERLSRFNLSVPITIRQNTRLSNEASKICGDVKPSL